ncbi:MAG: nucleotidyl transferase AbiEii/AbiGii toxin family protein [Lachnospiraceae bacterium]|nr:nucleotidyl transferase AbiEii/AbiGii toxin family protein [Lachnospiraceae bacterium]
MAYLHEDREHFPEAVNLAVFKTGLEPEVIEKDYYVTMVLKQLSELFPFLVFKGGTSLQKCYRIISRFSEDIDISADISLSQGQKRNLKYGIVDGIAKLGMTIPNIQEIRSRRDYNRYELAYHSVLEKLSDTVVPEVLLEISLTEVSFPAEILPVHSYIGDLFQEEAPEMIRKYGLDTFQMKVQSVSRTLIDKVFAICDYFLKGNVKRHSRHIYDISRLLPVVALDGEFYILAERVRAARAKTNICPAAMPGVNIPELLIKIVKENIYKEDYNTLTVKLLEEKVSYEEAIGSVQVIAESGMF